MIIIKVRNGIGNQLFTYALGLYLKMRNPDQEIEYDVSNLPLYVNGRYTVSFTDFVNDANLLNPKEVRHYLGKIFYFGRFHSNQGNRFDNLIKKMVDCVRIPRGFELIKEPDESEKEMETFADEIFGMTFKNNKTYVFDGFWENTRYIDAVKSQLKANITFEKVRIKEEYSKFIYKDNIVAVHIRRGDYIRESFSKNYPRYFYAYCDERYYDIAINLIKQWIRNPIFVFFSDDPIYVKNKYKTLNNKVVVEGQRDYEDLYLMTLCKHHIIANSTFSFWGSYIARQEGITIAPNMHYAYLKNSNDIWYKKYFVVPGWKYIDVGDRL